MRTLLLSILLTFFTGAFAPAGAAPDERGAALRLIAPTGEAAQGELWLLAIGIDNYLSWPRLKTAVNDAKAVERVLLKRYNVDASHVVELLDERATRQNILGALRDLAKRVKPEDSLLVYYAGHGHIDGITHKGSWIPVESGTDDPTSWIGNRDVTDYLSVDAIKARHVLLVSDSCFSGDFFRGSRGALPTVDDAFLNKAYARSSRQAISSGGLEPVSDAGFGGNSVFAHFLVAALEVNAKPYLATSEVFGEIRAGVGRNAEQLPQFGDLHGTGGQEGGELILFLRGGAGERLNELGAASATRQKELEALRRAEKEAAAAKAAEDAELAKKQSEVDALDRQIAEMKSRLGSSSAQSGNSMDQLLALADQKAQQGERLEELRHQREAEERKRQQEIEQLKAEASEKRRGQVEDDLAKFKKIAANKYAKDMKPNAWRTLVASYPEAKDVPQYDVKAFRKAVVGSMGFREGVTGMDFMTVDGGCFLMGDLFDDGPDFEKPAHEVCVSDFALGTHDVTVGEFRRFVEATGYKTEAEKDDSCTVYDYDGRWKKQAGTSWRSPGFNQDEHHPVVCVSWNDAQAFATWMNSLGKRQYRLPTETEWEYAARSGGQREKYAGFSDPKELYRYANFCDANCENSWKDESQNDGYNRTSPVGSFLPNGLGLYDMTGNVFQWTRDWSDKKYYSASPKDNPQGPSTGSYRVFRGGSWRRATWYGRASARDWFVPGDRTIDLGFRLATPVQ